MPNNVAKPDNTVKNILIIFLLVVIFLILSTLASILIPFVLALLLAVLFQPLISLLKKKGIPGWINLPAVSILSLVILFVIGFIFFNAAEEIVSEQDYLVEQFTGKVDSVLRWAGGTLGLPRRSEQLIDEITKAIDTKMLSDTLGGLAVGLTGFMSSFFMFALYYVVILAGMSNYKAFLLHLGGKEKGHFYLYEYDNIRKSVFQYMWVKMLVSVLTGLMTFLICWAFGIKFALFWGFVAFLFDFIPSIGSTIGSMLPILMSIIQFDSFGLILGVALLLVAAHMTMGNLVEPILLGSAMDINTTTIIFGLVFWGYIWGAVGMILSVPLLVIIKIILQRLPDFEVVSRLMGYPDKQTKRAAVRR